jgi:molybdate transport system ATP-binding protein
VALVQGILACPELLLLDEPFSALDFATRHKTAQALKTHTRELGIAVVLVSHAPHELASICEQLLVINNDQLTGPHPDPLKILNQQQNSEHSPAPTTTFLKASLVSFDPNHHLAHFDVSGMEILVASKNKPEQNEIIEIPASEVSIILEQPAATSIANCIQVTLDDWIDVDDGCLLKLKFSEQFLTSKITQYSFQKLKLAKNMSLFAQFKATAIDIL